MKSCLMKDVIYNATLIVLTAHVNYKSRMQILQTHD